MAINGETKVHTFFNYDIPPEKGGDTFFYPGTASAYRRAFHPIPHTVTDVRGHQSDFFLDQHGFEFHKHKTQETFNHEESIKSQHTQELSEFLKQKTGATCVVPFSHIVRRGDWEKAAEKSKDAPDLEVVRSLPPARYVHVDQSYVGATMVLEQSLPEEAESLAKKRWGIINVWRPTCTITRDPFAVCDARSVPDSDLFGKLANLPPKGSGTFENVTAGKNFELWAVRANPDHKWYYVSDMTPGDVVLVKCFDSKRDGRARRAPHSAFVDPRTKNDPNPRESIEVRCLVFWDEDADCE